MKQYEKRKYSEPTFKEVRKQDGVCISEIRPAGDGGYYYAKDLSISARQGFIKREYDWDKTIMWTHFYKDGHVGQFLFESKKWEDFDQMVWALKNTKPITRFEFSKAFPFMKEYIDEWEFHFPLKYDQFDDHVGLYEAFSPAGNSRAMRILNGLKVVKPIQKKEDAMAVGEREFVRTTIKEDGKPPLPAFKLTCAKCGATDTLLLGSKSNGYPTPLVQQKMRHRGWEIGSRASADLCPDCVAKKHKKHNKTETTQESNVVTFIKVEQPQEMTREDRRLIFAKIDEVYLDENTGYSEGWTDNRVANDLGVPLAWVKNIRSENFGEEQSNAAMAKQLDEVKAVLAQAKKLHLDSKDGMRDMSVQIEKASTILKQMNESMAKMQKEINAMNHEIARQESKISDVWKSLGK